MYYGTEFTCRVLDEWVHRRGMLFDFIHPGRPLENGFIESFNGILRDECLNANQFLSIANVPRKIRDARIAAVDRSNRFCEASRTGFCQISLTLVRTQDG